MQYGVEIEAENIFEPFPIDRGRFEEDGSLRNGGIEYISEILGSPSEAKKFHEVVIESLLENGADFSERCGVHIHVNMKDRSREEISSFLHKYLLMERKIFSIVGHNRDHNTFCLPLLDSDGDFSDLKRYLRTGSYSALLETSKYIALNFIPIYTQGSIEFRMLQTTNDLSIFNQVVDIIEDINELNETELVQKYQINEKDVLEANAYYGNLISNTPNPRDMEFLEHHFRVESADLFSTALLTNLLTREQVLEYLQRN